MIYRNIGIRMEMNVFIRIYFWSRDSIRNGNNWIILPILFAAVFNE